MASPDAIIAGAGLRQLLGPAGGGRAGAAAGPHATPNPAIYLCSAAVPPGPGMHGTCGYHAALSVLQRTFGRKTDPAPS